MMSRVLLGAQVCRHTLLRQFRRNLGISAIVAQKASGTIDPIQQLFLDKVRDYAKKSKPGELVDASPDTMKSLADDLDKITKAYGADTADFTQFPTFNFSDVTLDPVGVNVDSKAEVQTAVETEEAVNDRSDKPYWEI